MRANFAGDFERLAQSHQRFPQFRGWYSAKNKTTFIAKNVGLVSMNDGVQTPTRFDLLHLLMASNSFCTAYSKQIEPLSVPLLVPGF